MTKSTQLDPMSLFMVKLILVAEASCTLYRVRLYCLQYWLLL